MPRTRSVKPSSTKSNVALSAATELVGLNFSLEAIASGELYPQYTIGLHAWFLNQIREFDPELSAYLHDGESEKPFTISGLNGQFTAHSRALRVEAGATYQWQVTALSKPVVRGIATWLKQLPDTVDLKGAPLKIQAVALQLPPLTYKKLWQQASESQGTVDLSFLTPTSFRRRGHHFPLPVPTNLFHSYLRRWNDFSGQPFEDEAFLDWVEDCVTIQQHQLMTEKVAAGKRGSVTGFKGAIRLGLSNRAADNPEFQQLFYALVQLAPYCGTGHKTTFGLGCTHLGWQVEAADVAPTPTMQTVLADRIGELTEYFIAQRKRQGGDRAIQIAETWATILARRELGESLQEIAADLDLVYDTAKTYVKLARRSLRGSE
jgi:CRISPR-associated endoribonuclease Cas6